VIAPDDNEKRELVLQHLPLARRLAQRYASTPNAVDDLTQVAYLGLVKAVDRFDPAREVSLASFAIPTILGELKRWFRDTRWAAHVPRELQERALKVERELADLTTTLGRSPTPAELAERMGLDTEEVLEAREVSRRADAWSLDAPLGRLGDDGAGDGAGALVDTIGAADEGYETVEEVATIRPLIAALSARERAVIELRFGKDMSQREIAERVGVSQMHVSRILRRALREIRDVAEAA
jgi:RNA polymerase sigma-B factor